MSKDKQTGEHLRVIHQVPCLHAVDKGHPSQVPKRQHEPKPVRGDVHGRQNGCLIP